MNRSSKWYRNNEAGVMKDLNLTPTKNSGSGWIEKEDGQSEKLICQLKSTDAESIKVNKLDLDKLNRNASISHKIPMFAIQFIKSNEVYLIIKPEYLRKVSEEYNDNVVYSQKLQELILDDSFGKDEDLYNEEKESISGAFNAREAFHNDIKEKYKKEKSAK